MRKKKEKCWTSICHLFFDRYKKQNPKNPVIFLDNGQMLEIDHTRKLKQKIYILNSLIKKYDICARL